MIYANATLPSWAIVLILLGVFGLIVLIVILVKRHVSALQIKKDNIDEKQAIQQELDRILVPIDEKDLNKQEAEKKDETKEN